MRNREPIAEVLKKELPVIGKDLGAVASARAFVRTRPVEMPANNLMLVYRR